MTYNVLGGTLNVSHLQLQLSSSKFGPTLTTCPGAPPVLLTPAWTLFYGFFAEEIEASSVCFFVSYALQS